MILDAGFWMLVAGGGDAIAIAIHNLIKLKIYFFIGAIKLKNGPYTDTALI
jgi:hypothetical protein